MRVDRILSVANTVPAPSSDNRLDGSTHKGLILDGQIIFGCVGRGGENVKVIVRYTTVFISGLDINTLILHLECCMEDMKGNNP